MAVRGGKPLVLLPTIFFGLTLYITPFGDGLDHGVNLEGNTLSLVSLLSFCAEGKELGNTIYSSHTL